MEETLLAVVGYNEAEYLRDTLLGLQGTGKTVWFVDSDSTDSSREIALSLGVPVLDAPRGKGAAVREALQELPYGKWLLLFDGDAGTQSAKVAKSMLRGLPQEPGMVLGQFQSYGLLPSTQGIYAPLVEELFPEIGDRYGTRPLSGFRAVSRGFELDPPDDFGVEAYLNISVVMQGGCTQVVDIGPFTNPFRAKPDMPWQISKTILDLAEAYKNLSSSRRSFWEKWVDDLAGPLREYKGQGSEEVRRHLLRTIAERPLSIAPKIDYEVEDRSST